MIVGNLYRVNGELGKFVGVGWGIDDESYDIFRMIKHDYLQVIPKSLDIEIIEVEDD